MVLSNTNLDLGYADIVREEQRDSNNVVIRTLSLDVGDFLPY